MHLEQGVGLDAEERAVDGEHLGGTRGAHLEEVALNELHVLLGALPGGPVRPLDLDLPSTAVIVPSKRSGGPPGPAIGISFWASRAELVASVELTRLQERLGLGEARRRQVELGQTGMRLPGPRDRDLDLLDERLDLLGVWVRILMTV